MPDREKNARRPVMSAATFASLLETADGMALELLVLANGTARRISAICELRWRDVDLEERTDAPFGSIRWPEDTDKEGRASTVEMDPTCVVCCSAVTPRFCDWSRGSDFPAPQIRGVDF